MEAGHCDNLVRPDQRLIGYPLAMQALVAIVGGVLCAVFAAAPAAAQDLVISNARIIVGNGTVIESGALVVRGGRIASVGAGAPAPAGARQIDGRGLTLMPGFIDGHRHIISGNADQWLKDQAATRMQEFLEAGYTTLLAGGGPAEGNLELKRRLDAGVLKGPRVIPAAQINLNNTTPEQARAEMRRLAGLGIRFIGEENINPKPPTPGQIENLRAIVDESKNVGALVMVHAVSPQAMVAAVDAGVPLLVHTPHFGWVTNEEAKKVAAAGVLNLSTAAFGVPLFDVFSQDNVPTFRDGKRWPDDILDGDGRGQEAGYKTVNARTLWDNGVVYGFGTDTGYLPLKGLAQELKALNLMFSMKDIVKLMGPNTAAFVQMSRDIGSLEPGKLADIVAFPANPLDGYWNMLNAVVVIKGGDIVVDKRAGRR
ncbi:MAG: amidohydrolase family protein [Acidobacteria bacterium]|nr:amidohydrolase family protein [Acidobacteriota bacterium]